MGRGGSESKSMTVVERNARVSESLLWGMQRRFYTGAGLAAWAEDIVPNFITCNAYIADVYAAVVVAHWQDLLMRPVTVGGEPGLDLSQPVYLLELGSGAGKFGYQLLHALERRVAEYPHLAKLDWKVVLTDFVAVTVEGWLSNPQYAPFLAKGRLDVAVYDCMAPYDPIVLKHSGKVLTQGSIVNPPVLFANYLFCVVEVDAYTVTSDGSLYECFVTSSAPTDMIDDDSGKVPDKCLPSMQHEYRRGNTPIYTPGGVDNVEQQFRDTDPKKELAWILKYYARNMAAVARAGTETSFLFPIASMRCIDAFSRLTARGRQLLVLTSDKAYAHPVELMWCDPFSMSHEGSFSFMVNLHVLGMLGQRFGGVSRHSQQLSVELGDACLTTSMYLIDSNVVTHPPPRIAVPAAETIPSHPLLAQIVSAAARLRVDPKDQHRIVLEGDGDVFTEDAGLVPEHVYMSVFPSAFSAFSNSVVAFTPSDYFQLSYSRYTATTPDETENITKYLAMLRLSRWDPSAVMIVFDKLLAAVDATCSSERVTIARGAALSLQRLFFIGERSDVAFDIGRIMWHLHLPRHELAMLCYKLSLERAGPHAITYYNLALCCVDREEYRDALEYLDQSLALDPSYEPASTLLTTTRAKARDLGIISAESSSTPSNDDIDVDIEADRQALREASARIRSTLSALMSEVNLAEGRLDD